MQTNRLKILYTIPNFDTAGSGIALMKLIARLDKEMFEPHILCVHNRGKFFKEIVSKSGIPVYLYPYTGTIRPYSKAFIRIFKLANFIRERRYDIVFSYHYAADYIEAIASRLAGAKFFYVKKNMSWFGSSYRAWKLKTFFANKVFVQNTDMIKLFYTDSKKACLVSIGVDMSEYFPQKSDQKLKEEFGILDTDKVVLCVANIAPKKGIDLLIVAIKKIIETNKKVKLLIVGDDKDELELANQLKNEIISNKLSSNVYFTGKRFDVKRFYSIADLFVLPSTGNEGAPISIQEAMASGLIVITTDTPGNRDQLESLPNQLAVPGNSDHLTNKIVKYLNVSEEEKKYIIKEQLSIVNNRYSLETEVMNHESIYKKYLK